MSDKPLPISDRYLKKTITVLYEDSEVVVFDKPAGLLVIPTIKKEDNTLVNIVNFQNANKDQYKLHPCHRLDKETSGVIIFAKGKGTQQRMMELFQNRLIKKKYIALVQGNIKQKEGKITKSIGDKHSGFKKNFKPALTNFYVSEIRKNYSIVEVEPVTGRTNQIRIHFSQIGHPIIGDRKYSVAKDYTLKFRRTALHAHKLAWSSPFTHKQIKIQSELPKDMEVFIASH